MSATFRSLRVVNYRLWFAGALVSNIGAWMQRTAQDWIVLTKLTDHDATAVGITMALQFGPLLLLMPLSGLMADRVDRRRLLMWTQGLSAVLATGLGILVMTGAAQLWHVYGFALLLGIVSAIDVPARQAFASELVTNSDLSNAVALNSTSFQTARLIGPAAAGVLIALIGEGPVFLLNGLSFAGVLVSLGFIRRTQLQPALKLPRARGQIRDGLRYVGSRPDIVLVLVMVFLIGTFGFNFPVFVSTMATIEFHQDASGFGLLTSMMAVGAVAGALLAARRDRARLPVIVVAAAAFGVAAAVAALTSGYWAFALVLVFVGFTSMTMMNTANAYVQTTTEPHMRGRVMALYMAIFAGGTPIGAPIAGIVANQFGPRWSLGIAAASGIIAAAIAIVWIIRRRRLRIRWVPAARWPVQLRSAVDEARLVAQQEAIDEATVAARI